MREIYVIIRRNDAMMIDIFNNLIINKSVYMSMVRI